MRSFDEAVAPLKNYYQQLLPTMCEDDWQFCASLVSIRQLRKREFLVREGQLCNHVSFVSKGLVSMYYLVDGKEKIIEFCNELNYTADYRSFLTRQPSMLYLQALEPTELLETSYEGLQLLYDKVPGANKLGRLIAEQLFIDMCDSANMEKNDTIYDRYYKLVQEQPWLLQRVPQYMIASYLGITPEALSRVKARMGKPRPVLVPA